MNYFTEGKCKFCKESFYVANGDRMLPDAHECDYCFKTLGKTDIIEALGQSQQRVQRKIKLFSWTVSVSLMGILTCLILDGAAQWFTYF